MSDPRPAQIAADPRLTTVTVDRLVGIAEIAQLLGVQRTTVDLWRTRDRKGRSVAVPMPQPLLPRVGDTTKTPLWDREEILRWAHATGRVRSQQPAATS